MNQVIDTSIVIKWFLEEEHSDLALIIHEKAVQKEITLHTTDLLYFEFTNALATKRLEETVKQQMIGDLYITPLTIHPFTDSLAISSLTLAQPLGISVYDASYIALAQELNCEFLTVDERLVKATLNLSFVKLLE